ncbi:MAG: hypothetical protein K0U98_17020 [Deltaproteobacteria bacterium]|nr:hypothetical protein [Deltaproteobacteria bacterium]
MMRPFLKTPAPWLVLQSLAVLLWHGVLGKLEPKRVGDVHGYLELVEADSLGEILTSVRTYGYPLFLKVFGVFFDGLGWVPPVQLVLYLASVVLFWWALSRYSGRKWLALAAASPLFYGSMLEQIRRLQADFLGATWALVTVSLLLRLATRPASRWRLGMVGAALAMTYHTRPAYLFLVVLVPLVGPFLRWCREATEIRELARWTVRLTATAVVPYLLYCTLRLVVVGHFGLVSFGGLNMIGLAGSFLDADLVAELPAQDQSLAGEILAAREAKGYKPMVTTFPARRWYSQYDFNVWQVAIPLVEEKLGPRKETFPAINETLTGLSGRIIRLRPGLYKHWLVGGLIYGIGNGLSVFWILVPAFALFCSLPLALTQIHPRPEGGAALRIRDPVAEGKAWSYVLALVGLSGVYFLGSLSLVVVIEVPGERYLQPAVLLLPSALCAILFQLWKQRWDQR